MSLCKRNLMITGLFGCSVMLWATSVAVAQSNHDDQPEMLNRAALTIDGSARCNVTQSGVDFQSCSINLWQACGLPQPAPGSVVSMDRVMDLIDGQDDGDHGPDDLDMGQGQGQGQGSEDQGGEDQEAIMLFEMLGQVTPQMIQSGQFENMIGTQLSQRTKQQLITLSGQIRAQGVGRQPSPQMIDQVFEVIDGIEQESQLQEMAQAMGVSIQAVNQMTFLETSLVNDGRNALIIWGPGSLQFPEAQPQMIMVQNPSFVEFQIDCAPRL